jgi:hypothetical protein
LFIEGLQKSSPPFEKGRRGGIYALSFQKTKLIRFSVIPAKAGIQYSWIVIDSLDSGACLGPDPGPVPDLIRDSPE